MLLLAAILAAMPSAFPRKVGFWVAASVQCDGIGTCEGNAAVQAALVAPMRLVAVMLPVVAVGLVLSQALYGAGANVYVMVAEGVLHAGVLVPMSWLLGPTLGYGLLGCWAGGGVYVAGLAIAMAARFAGRSWREIEI